MISLELIIKYLSGKASPMEAQRVDQWIDDSETNRDYFHSVHAAWLLAGEETMIIPDATQQWNKFKKELPADKPAGKIISLRPLTIAASFIGVCLLAYFLVSKTESTQENMLAQANTDTLVVKLADETDVKVYPNSKLDYPEAFASNDREVKLTGSGFFNVTPDKSKPFIIDAGPCKVQVLGTSFEVLHIGNDVVVNVMTGKVRVYNTKGEIVLVAGEKAICNAEGAISLQPKNSTSTISLAKVEFDEITLSKLAEVLKERGIATLEFRECLGKKDLILQGVSTDDSLETILEGLVPAELTYKNEGGKVIVSGSCD